MTEPIEKIGHITNASILKCTGRSWEEWGELLDQNGGRNLPYRDLVAFLKKKKFKVTAMWQMHIAIGYEVMIGRRAEGRNSKGEYSVTLSRTFAIDAKKLWKIVTSEAGLAIWAKPLDPFPWAVGSMFETEDGILAEIRTMKAGTRVRLRWTNPDWPKPSVVQIMVIPQPKGKSMFIVMHESLVDGRAREPVRARWKEVADGLRALIES